MRWKWCVTCLADIPVVDESEEQIGYEERAREVHVVHMECGHDIVTEVRYGHDIETEVRW